MSERFGQTVDYEDGSEPWVSQTNAEFRRLLDTLPAGAYTCDAEGLITYFNQHAEQLWGRAPGLNDPADRYCGSFKLFAADGSPVAHDECWMALALNNQEQYIGREIIVERPDGQRRTVLAHASPIHCEQSGALMGAVNVLVDISERKQQQEILQLQSQELLNLVERAPDIISRFDRELRHLYVNPAIALVTEVSPEQFIGKTHEDLGMSEDLVAKWQTDLRRVFKTGKERANEFDFLSPQGIISYHARLVPERNDQGVVESVLVIARDVSELKAAEREKIELLEREKSARLIAEKANRELRFLANASEILNSSLDYEVTLRSVAELAVPNMADWCAIDFMREDASIQRVALVYGDSDKAATVRGLQQHYPSKPGRAYGIMNVFETGQPQLYSEISDAMLSHATSSADELAEIRSLGMKSALIVPLKTHAGLVGAISLVMAESDRRYGQEDVKLAEELARRAALAIDNSWLYRRSQVLNEVLEAKVASRTEALTRANTELESFCYAVSHDLRAPLRAIQGFSQALVESHVAELGNDAKHYLARISANAERMGELIDKLLMLSSLSRQPLRPEPVNPCELALEIAGELTSDQPQRVDFQCDAGYLIEADRGLLRIVLVNLLENALKFSSKRDTTKIRLSTQIDKGTVVFGLNDNGTGFNMQYADRLFVPFKRLHRARDYPGTGIGLATAKRIIDQHGGRIWAESVPDEGSTFFFSVPSPIAEEP